MGGNKKCYKSQNSLTGKRLKVLLYYLVFNISGLLLAQENIYYPLEYARNGTPIHGVKIKTNLPFQNGSQMPTIIIEGYNYGKHMPIGLTINWYVYGNKFINHSITSHGAYAPRVQLAVEYGKVIIFLDEREYFNRFSVRAFGKSRSQDVPSNYENWTVVDEPLSNNSSIITPLVYNSWKKTHTSVGLSKNINYEAGNVGIGTEVPFHKLDVKVSGSTNFKTYDFGSEITVQSNEGWARALRIRNETTNSSVAYGAHNGDAYISTGFDINVGPVGHTFKKFIVKSNGNVGVGTVTPDMKLSVSSQNKYISRYHSTDKESAFTGIRLGRKTLSGASYADLVNLNNGFGIAAGYSSSNLPLNTQNESDIAIFTTYNNKNVGIGTIAPGNWKLAVNGKIRSKEIKVETDWSDFVFEEGYNLPTLQEVEKYIEINGHLQDIPSARDVAENGIFLGEMNAKLLQKIEELMLYTIEQQKELDLLKDELLILKR